MYAFTRPGDERTQAFARSQGAVWAGGTDERRPEALDAALIFAPAGELVPLALRAVGPGGVVVCGGIHMSDIPSFPYADLWGRARRCAPSRTSRAPTAASCWRSRRASRCARRSRPTALEDAQRGARRPALGRPGGRRGDRPVTRGQRPLGDDSTSSADSSRLSTLPVALRGSSSRNTISRGTL